MSPSVIRLWAGAPLVGGLVFASARVLSRAESAGGAAFDRLFPSYVSWEELGVARSSLDYRAAVLCLALFLVVLPTLVAGLVPALAALWLRLPPIAVGAACMFGACVGVFSRYPLQPPPPTTAGDLLSYALALAPAAGAAPLLATVRRNLARRDASLCCFRLRSSAPMR